MHAKTPRTEGLLRVMNADARALLELLAQARDGAKTEHHDALMRSFIRILCVELEAFIASMKEHCLRFNSPSVRDGAKSWFTRAELVLLRESTQTVYSLSKGEPVSQVRRASTGFRDNLRFAANMAARTVFIRFEWDRMPGWAGIPRLVAIRNRLTHPRTIEDLSVTAEEFQAAAAAYEFLGFVTSALKDRVLEFKARKQGSPPMELLCVPARRQSRSET